MTKPGTGKCACGKIISANAERCAACAHESRSKKLGGSLQILNVQGGDVKISFDRDNVPERIRAKRIITDMLRRGYAIVVEVERDGKKAYERIQEFDEARGEYILADLDPLVAQEADRDDPPDLPSEQPPAQPPATGADLCACGRPARHRGRCRGLLRRVPMTASKAVGIGRSAGG